MTNSEIEKKEQIIKAARELFFRFGYSKTSMDDIAHECGMAKPTLYYYFPNKEAIFDEIVWAEANEFMNQIVENLPSDSTADIKLQRFLQSIYQKLEVYASELEDIPDVLCDHSPHGRPIVKKLSELFQEKLRPVLEEGIREGIFKIDDMEATLAAISFLLEFLDIDWIRHYEKDLRDRIIEVINNIILNGLKRRSQ